MWNDVFFCNLCQNHKYAFEDDVRQYCHFYAGENSLYIFYVTDKLINQMWIIGLIFQDRARISQMAFVQGQVFTGRNYRTNNSFQ